VQNEVEEAFYMERMEPAIRAYLTKLREEAYIDIRTGYADSGASAKESKPVYSAYVPPSPKKKAKVERVRFRESGHGFRDKSGAAAAPTATDAPVAAAEEVKPGKHQGKNKTPGVERPGNKEKIRYGQKPRQTLPAVPNKIIEDAGALPDGGRPAEADAPVNPLEQAPAADKSRFSKRARLPKQPKQKLTLDAQMAPAAPDSEEVADRQSQSAPLGLSGNTAAQKKAATATGDKTRLSQKKQSKKPKTEQQQEQNFTPLPQIKGAPAPADHSPAPASTETPAQTPDSPAPTK
jgi:peptidyl-prolyl cis-trans isomerase SurA